jgi:AMMECR1 domain-containing protein
LLLPRVPLDHGWDLETFLEKTCLKAGLHASAWRDRDAEIQGFRCEVFDEDEEGASHS